MNEHEFCPRCEANLTLQKGYSNTLPYWICKGCGEMLINPEVDAESDIAWICDGCEAMLNVQPGFSEDCGEWICTECGFKNTIDLSDIYLSDDEYRLDIDNPYRGLNDTDVIKLMEYQEIKYLNDKENVSVIAGDNKEKAGFSEAADADKPADSSLYVKKVLSTYDASIYRFLKQNPIPQMPKIYEIFESENALIVIEEYIEGRPLSDILSEGEMTFAEGIYIAKEICRILSMLHGLDNPIIHRDIKPSNIIITPDNKVFLLDVNAAKWYKEDESEDTKLLGTMDFAAPEQFGFGLSASTAKADIYGAGVLLNVMVTGGLPKEIRAPKPLWEVIEKCISLEADNRYTADELYEALNRIERMM